MSMLLAIDIGSSAIKVGLVAMDGGMYGQRNIPVHYMRDSGDTDIDGWFAALTGVCDEIIDCQLAGIMVCGQGPSLVGVQRIDGARERSGVDDEHQCAQARVVHPVLFREALSRQSIPRRADSRSVFLPYARWFMDNYPSEYGEVTDWLPLPEYFVYLLCGVRCAALPSTDYMPYYWSAKDMDSYQLDGDRFPPMVGMGGRVGGLHPRFMRRWKQQGAVPLLAGGLDFIFALLGTGTTGAYSMCDRGGSSHGINVTLPAAAALSGLSQSPLSRLLHTYPHPMAELVNTSLVIDHGRGIASSKKDFADFRRWLYGGDGGVRARGAGGKPGPARVTVERSGNITINPTGVGGAEVQGYLRLECVLFCMRLVVRELEKLNCAPKSINFTGGQAGNRVWNQLKCDLCGIPGKTFRYVDSELIGMGAVGWFYLGGYASLERAVGSMVGLDCRYEPANGREGELPGGLGGRYRGFVDNI